MKSLHAVEGRWYLLQRVLEKGDHSGVLSNAKLPERVLFIVAQLKILLTTSSWLNNVHLKSSVVSSSNKKKISEKQRTLRKEEKEKRRHID